MPVSDYKVSDEEFVRLLTQYQRPLFRFIFCLVHSMHDAEDLFQQVAITLWGRFGEFRPGTDFFSWACAIAKNKALNYFKSSGRRRAYFSPQLIDEIAEREHGLAELYEARLQALEVCRQKLSSVDRELLAACYDGSQSVRVAAAKIGRPIGSIYTSLSRIRRALHGCIERTLANGGYR